MTDDGDDDDDDDDDDDRMMTVTLNWACSNLQVGGGGGIAENILMYGTVLLTGMEIHTKHINTVCVGRT